MKQSSGSILLLVALLLSWGQVLAAPFMPCHHDAAGVGTARVAVQQADHPHAGHHHAATAVSHHAHGAAVPAALIHDQVVMHATSDCDPDCRLQCVTLVTLALPSLPFLASTAAPAAHGSMADAFPPARPLAAHFRPPQHA